VRRAAGVAALWLAVSVTRVLSAQSPGAALLLIPSHDSVHVLLTEPPAFGFAVYRRIAGEAASFERVSSAPVTRPVNPRDVAAMIGADLPAVMRALKATDETQVARRLMYDRFTSAVLAAMYPSVARALGERYVDTTAAVGSTYEYRIVFTNARGSEAAQAITQRVRVQDTPPAPPTGVRAAPLGRDMAVTWSYPAAGTNADDHVITLRLYRADNAEAAPRMIATIVRADGAPREYRDTDVRPGASYAYTMRAVDIVAREGVPSAAARAVMVDNTPLSIPADVMAKAGDGWVRLTWRMSPEARVAGYRVERSSGLDKPFTRQTPTLIPQDQPAWVDTSVTFAQQYFYRVVAVDSAGMSSAPSEAMNVMAEDHTPPQPPGDLEVTLRGHHAVLNWRASPSGDVKGYFVYRGDDTTRLVRLNAIPLSATQFVDSGFATKGLVPGHSYALRVSAIDRASNESAKVSATVTLPDDEPPAPPTGFRARGVDGRYVELLWSPSPSRDVRGYEARRVERGAIITPGGTPVAESGQAARVVATVGARDQRTVHDTSAAHGRRYVYELIAIDSAGNRSEPVRDTVEFRSVAPPPATRFVEASVVVGGVAVHWEPVVDRELAGYNVYRASVPTGVPERVNKAPVSGTTLTDSTGTSDAYYTVRAVDSSGNESRASVPVRAPAARRGGP
jgi:fibronectin type 3 domain-containing protein